jgi:hypothetical protein
MTDAEIAAMPAAVFSQATLDAEMDAANEPDPDDPPAPDARPVMPANALRRQQAPGGLWPLDG